MAILLFSKKLFSKNFEWKTTLINKVYVKKANKNARKIYTQNRASNVCTDKNARI
jgi:hypothetical protein